jgi:ribosome biogenesis protein BMS1
LDRNLSSKVFDWIKFLRIGIFKGAKLFLMSGMKNGEYIQRDVHNLARFISVMKFKPSTWKTTHPFIVADR